MNDIRARFEEIWPVPEGVYWMPLSRNGGEYMADPRLTKDNRAEAQFAAEEWDARLDTFTRCQEIMAPVLSLIDELVADLQYRVLYNAIEDDNERSQVRINQIKKILGA